MISPVITNIFANPGLATLTQNTNASVATETFLKAVGRPGFIMADKSIDDRTKKYAAFEEFVHQMTCFAVYLALVVPVFKRGTFKLAKTKFFKDEVEFTKFRNFKEYDTYRKLATKKFDERSKFFNNPKNKDFFIKNVEEDLKANAKPTKYPLIKGTIELGSTIGSVLGMAILAPEINHYTLHPILKLVGLEENKTNSDTK